MIGATTLSITAHTGEEGSEIHKERNPLDFKRLWSFVIDQFPMGIHSIHGPRHWKQVEKNGLSIAKETGADETIVMLFSIFHDSRRENERGQL
jgi:uncharacterized protein